MKLSKNQEKAVKHIGGPAMVLAGPGSGKTFVITRRLLNLVFNEGIDPSSILVITFTRAAAEEMADRFKKLVYEKTGKNSDLDVRFGTFHSFFLSVLKQETGFSHKNLISDTDKYKILKAVLYEKNRKDLVKEEYIFDILFSISSYKSKDCIKESSLLSLKETEGIISSYEDELKARGLMDFDDILIKFYELLSKDEELREKLSNRYRYILLDEFQDISPIQYKSVKLLAKKYRNIFIVGDDDQSIYGFRDADPRIMLGFPKDYPDVKIIHLQDNFRSRKEICDFAGRVINHNKKRFKKKVNSFRGKGGEIKLYISKSLHSEYDLICDNIISEIESGTKPSDIAVLYRSYPMITVFLNYLEDRKINYIIGGKTPDPYRHYIYGDILSYLKLAKGSADVEELVRVMNRPSRFIARKSLNGREIDFKAMLKYYENSIKVSENIKKFIVDLKYLRNLNAYDAIGYIFYNMKYMDFLKNRSQNNHENLGSLYDIIINMQKLSKGYDDISSFISFMEKRRNGNLLDKISEVSDDNSIRLMTYHFSKGLEFKSIHIPDLVEGVVPDPRVEDEGNIEEERRAFYVAVTRAMDRLSVYSSRERYGREVDISRFIKEGSGKKWKF